MAVGALFVMRGRREWVESGIPALKLSLYGLLISCHYLISIFRRKSLAASKFGLSGGL
jgi:hypothetical protein